MDHVSAVRGPRGELMPFAVVIGCKKLREDHCCIAGETNGNNIQGQESATLAVGPADGSATFGMAGTGNGNTFKCGMGSGIGGGTRGSVEEGTREGM